MRTTVDSDFDRPPDGSRWAVASVVASLVALIGALALCAALIAAATGREPLLWSGSPDDAPAFVIAGLWVVAAIAGIVCGFIALVLRYPKRLRPLLATVLGVVSLLIVPATAVAALTAWASPHHPSDDSMLSDFQQHRPQFDQTAAALADTGHVDRKPLRDAGIEVQHVERYLDATLLSVSSWGIVPSGSAKGYAYSQKSLDPLATGDTQHFAGVMPDEIVFRHISGPWYIYFESW
jgi:hypothetical protein